MHSERYRVEFTAFGSLDGTGDAHTAFESDVPSTLDDAIFEMPLVDNVLRPQ